MAAGECDVSTITAPQNVFNKSMTFPQNLSAYFKRPTKVTKSSSRNQSPRTNSRRRMTTHVPVRTRSMGDSHRMGIGPQTLTRNSTTNARPISWHPSFMSDFEQYPVADQQLIHEPYEYPINTTFAYGLVSTLR